MRRAPRPWKRRGRNCKLCESRADLVKDVLQVQRELSSVVQQLEARKATMQRLSAQASLSTLQLHAQNGTGRGAASVGVVSGPRRRPCARPSRSLYEGRTSRGRGARYLRLRGAARARRVAGRRGLRRAPEGAARGPGGLRGRRPKRKPHVRRNFPRRPRSSYSPLGPCLERYGLDCLCSSDGRTGYAPAAKEAHRCLATAANRPASARGRGCPQKGPSSLAALHRLGDGPSARTGRASRAQGSGESERPARAQISQPRTRLGEGKRDAPARRPSPPREPLPPARNPKQPSLVLFYREPAWTAAEHS